MEVASYQRTARSDCIVCSGHEAVPGAAAGSGKCSVAVEHADVGENDPCRLKINTTVDDSLSFKIHLSLPLFWRR